jgi:hypothetical protein
MDKKCSECDFAILEDYGYSNWTVEGTSVICSKGLHPQGDFDRWYGQDDRDKIAETCEEFQSTIGPPHVDCEREEIPYGADETDPTFWEPYATEFVSAEQLRKTFRD